MGKFCLVFGAKGAKSYQNWSYPHRYENKQVRGGMCRAADFGSRRELISFEFRIEGSHEMIVRQLRVIICSEKWGLSTLNSAD
jgi:hypothetical protein